MARPLGVEDVFEPRPSVGVMLRRGCRKRCARCGAGHLFRGWFRMHDRCPGCGVRFEREPGFFVGAYLINFAITEGLLWLVVMAFVFVKASDGDASLVVPLAAGGVLAVVAPIVFYPWSRTIWSAIDLAMAPLELKEIAEAADATDHGDEVGD